MLYGCGGCFCAVELLWCLICVGSGFCSVGVCCVGGGVAFVCGLVDMGFGCCFVELLWGVNCCGGGLVCGVICVVLNLCVVGSVCGWMHVGFVFVVLNF